MKNTKIFVDLDGVLADFFAEYAKVAGVKSGKYRDVPPAKNDPTLTKLIGTDFFSKLPKFHSADTLISLVVSLFGEYNICSSPLRGDHEHSGEQKKIWVKENLTPQPKHVIIATNKAKYAVQPDGTPNILIDDRGSNISAWEAKGGIGIKYQADEDGMDVIVEGLARALRILKGKEEHTLQKLKSLNRSTNTYVERSGDSDFHPEDIQQESASGGSTSAGSVASLPSGGHGAGWLFGGDVGGPVKPKKKKSTAKVIRR